jgi:hypothetical protein
MARASALKRQKNRTALLGAIVLIIIITVITSVFMNIFHKSNPLPKINSVETTTYENYIAPLVILDISPFESISKAPQDELLLSSIWAVLLPKDAYEFADDGRMILPQADVETSYMNLFGVLPKHKSIDSRGQIFDYSSDDKCYYIPAQGIENSFSPHIIASKQSGKNITITVEYIPYDNWQQDTSGKVIPAKATKKMIYTLEKNASKLKILSVKKG